MEEICDTCCNKRDCFIRLQVRKNERNGNCIFYNHPDNKKWEK